MSAVELKRQDYEGNNDDYNVCMTGENFRNMISGEVTIIENTTQTWEILNLAAFRRISKTLKVLTMTTPQDKLLLVDGLKKVGRSVAVTG